MGRDLKEARNRKLGGFSGGMKQRVLLAREKPEELMDQMEGIVWETRVHASSLPVLEQTCLVSNVHVTKDGLSVRLLGEKEELERKLFREAFDFRLERAEANLEDVYLWRIRNED